MRILGLRALIIVFSTAGFGSSALAQSDAVVVSGPELGVMTQPQIELQIAELQNEYSSVNLARPRASLGLSAVLISAGAIAVGVGAAFRGLEGSDPSAGTSATIAVGALALVGGVIGVAISSRRLKRRKNEQQRIQLEILGFQNSLQSP